MFEFGIVAVGDIILPKLHEVFLRVFSYGFESYRDCRYRANFSDMGVM